MTRVVMKDGTIYRGQIWSWRPVLGWFTLAGAEDDPVQIFFREVASATTCGARTRVGHVEDRDELCRARADGWCEETE